MSSEWLLQRGVYFIDSLANQPIPKNILKDGETPAQFRAEGLKRILTDNGITVDQARAILKKFDGLYTSEVSEAFDIIEEEQEKKVLEVLI